MKKTMPVLKVIRPEDIHPYELGNGSHCLPDDAVEISEDRLFGILQIDRVVVNLRGYLHEVRGGRELTLGYHYSLHEFATTAVIGLLRKLLKNAMPVDEKDKYFLPNKYDPEGPNSRRNIPELRSKLHAEIDRMLEERRLIKKDKLLGLPIYPRWIG